MSTNRPPSCDHRFKDFKPLDKRPARGGYAPGEYFVKCRKCECGFTGDKRAYECADCAYAGSNRPPSCDLPPEFYRPKLKLCPFCGSNDVDLRKGYDHYDIRVYAHCNKCEADGPWYDDSDGSRWNSAFRRSDVLELIRLMDEIQTEPVGVYADWAKSWDNLRQYADKLRKDIGA